MKKLGPVEDRVKLISEALKSPELRSAILSGSETKIRALVATHLDVLETELPSEAIQFALRVANRRLPTEGDQAIGHSSVDAQRIFRFTYALAGALGEGASSTPAPATRGAWFSGAPNDIELHEVLAYLAAALPEEARVGPRDEALRQMGYEPLLTRLRSQSGDLRFALTDKGAHALAYRIREVNAALFGPVTFTLADGVRGLLDRPLAELPRVGEVPSQTSAPMFSSPPGSLVSKGLDVEPQSVISQPAPFLPHFGPNGAFFQNRAVIGEHGPELSFAIVEANRIALSLVEGAAGTLGSDVHAAVLGRLTNQKEAIPLLQEGIVSIGHALALLLAKKPANMTLDEALQKIGEQGLLAQLAIHAPFGQIAPMNAQGFVPTDPITENERGQLLIPRSLRKALETARANVQLPSMENVNGSEFPTETKMGCPVASRIPKQGAERRESPLHALAASYVDLVRKILREAPTPSEGR